MLHPVDDVQPGEETGMLAAKRHRPTALTKHGFKRVVGYSLEVDVQARAFDGRLLIGIDPIMPRANKSVTHCKRSTEIADSRQEPWS